MRKGLSWLLCAALLLALMPVKALAQPEPSFIRIEICQTEKAPYTVIASGSDLLFSGEDLAALSGYEYRCDGENAVFTRGCKTIRVDLGDNKLFPMEDLSLLSSVDLTEPVVQSGKRYYFSGSQLLPWLNVTCFAEDGVLYVVADAVSLWDFAEEFDPDQFAFDFEEVCSELGASSKWLKAAAYARNNGLGFVTDLVPVSLDFSYGTYKDYFDILDELFQNKESSVYAYDELIEGSERVQSSFDMIEVLDELENLPDELQTLVYFNKALSGMGKAADYAVYYDTFQQDNEQKLAMMEAITLNRAAYQYPEALVSAAMDIKDSYRNLWDGLVTRFLQDLTESSIDLLTTGIAQGKMAEYALTALGMYKAFTPDWAQGVDRAPKYEAIAAAARDVYEENFGGSHTYTIQLQRCHAMLYLYACEQNYRTMADYAREKDKADKAEQYEQIAEEALKWQGRFLASAPAEINDSHEYGDGHMKEDYTQALLSDFATLHKITSPTSRLAGVEYAMLLSALLEQSCDSLEWLLNDADGDGAQELLISVKSTGGISQLIADADSGRLWSYAATGVAGSSEFCQLDGETAIFFHDSYSTLGTQLSTYSRWNGLKWEPACVLNGSSTQDSQGQDQFSGESVWYGETISYEDYLAKEAQVVHPVQLDSPDLTNLTLAGDGTALLDELTEYLAARPGYLGCEQADLDGDGQNETLYFLEGASNLWFSQMQVANAWGSEPYLDYTDERLTILVARPTQENLTVRTARLENGTYAIENGQLSIDGVLYPYQASGAPFAAQSSNPGIPLMGLMGMTYEQVAQTAELEPLGADTALCRLGETEVHLSFSPSAGGSTPDANSIVLSVYCLGAALPEGTAITTNTCIGQTASELRQLLQPATEWPPISSLEGGAYGVSFLYRDTATDMIYRITLYLDGAQDTARCISVDIAQNYGITDEEAAQLAG